MRWIAKMARDERGASAVEYGLILSLIVIAVIAGLLQFADATISMWNNVSENVTSHT